MRDHNTISQANLKYSYYSRNLPHLFDTNKPIFITYRIKYTLPQPVIQELNNRKTEWLSDLQTLKDSERQNILKSKDETFFYWYDELIAKSQDIPKILHRTDIIEIISHSFRYFDNQRYELLAYCIMPNHVHVLILPITQPSGDIFSPSHITYTWKRYTC